MRRPPPAALLTAALLLGLASAQTAQTTQTQATPARMTPATSSAGQTGVAQSGTPLTLDAALTLLNNSPSVQGSRLSVQVAQTNLNAARSALGLTVSVTGSGTYTGPYTTTGTNASGDATTTNVAASASGSAGVNVSLGVLPWSTNQYSLRAAQRSLTLATAYLVDAQASARLNVVQQYYNAVNAQNAVTLYTQTLALRQRQLEIAQAKQTQGNAITETVLGARAALQTAQANLTQAQGNLDTALRSLGAALGVSVSGPLPTTPPTTFTLPDVNALVAQARATRSEVIYAQNNLAAAQDTLEQEQREVSLPTLTATVRYGPAGSGGLSSSLDVQRGTLSAGYSAPFGNGTDGSGTNRFVAGLSGSYVVYSPALQAQLAADRATVTQTTLSLSVAQQNVELDVRSKYNSAQNALLALQAQITQVQVAQTALQTAQARLAAGLGTADDVTSAQIALLTAQNTLQGLRVTAQLALITLQNAAGGQP